MNIEHHYIVDENNCKVAVQLSIETFEKIEAVLENHALYQLMQDHDDEELGFEDAVKHYQGLDKTQCN